MTVDTEKSYRLPTHISRTLVEVTDSSRPEEALNTVLKDYLDSKIQENREIIEDFREKWNMDFEEFKEKSKEEKLPENKKKYSREVEEDFREWEAAITLRQKYRRIREKLV